MPDLCGYELAAYLAHYARCFFGILGCLPHFFGCGWLSLEMRSAAIDELRDRAHASCAGMLLLTRVPFDGLTLTVREFTGDLVHDHLHSRPKDFVEPERAPDGSLVHALLCFMSVVQLRHLATEMLQSAGERLLPGGRGWRVARSDRALIDRIDCAAEIARGVRQRLERPSGDTPRRRREGQSLAAYVAALPPPPRPPTVSRVRVLRAAVEAYRSQLAAAGLPPEGERAFIAAVEAEDALGSASAAAAATCMLAQCGPLTSLPASHPLLEASTVVAQLGADGAVPLLVPLLASAPLTVGFFPASADVTFAAVATLGEACVQQVTQHTGRLAERHPPHHAALWCLRSQLLELRRHERSALVLSSGSAAGRLDATL